MSNEYKDWQAEEIKELKAQVERLEEELEPLEGRSALDHMRHQSHLEAKAARLEKVLREATDLLLDCRERKALHLLEAALEGKQGGVEKERCPHLAGDLCIKEGACECYGVEGGDNE